MAFSYREPGKIIADIIESEMDLKKGQVMFTNQKFNIPASGIFVAISYVGPSKIIPVNQWADDGATGLIEIQSIHIDHLVQIDILGYGNDVRTRKEEIAMAISSMESKKKQEENSMYIANQTGAFMDTSYLEVTKIVTRYTTTVFTTSVNEKRKAIKDIYTDFQRAVPPLLTVDA